MKKLRNDTQLQISILILGFSLICFIYAFCVDSLSDIIEGLKIIVRSKCSLLTDYYYIGGFGATLINCGLTTLSCLVLYKLSKKELDGLSIAVTFTLSGFSFFGKNILNLWPIIFGSFIYSLVFHIKFKEIIHIALLSTSLAPIVTEAYFIFTNSFVILNLFMAILFGTLIGFFTPQIAKFTPRCHSGCQLYNSGFAAGIVGMVFTAIINFFNHYVSSESVISLNYTKESIIFLLLVLIFMIIYSLILNPVGYKQVLKLIQIENSPDYTKVTCLSTVLLNMVTLAFVYTTIVLLLKVELSGPVIGGILTIVAFSAYGKNIFNTIFIAIGVIIFAELGHIKLNDINVILALLFGTCLAPIVDKYGVILGIVAGLIHVCIVMNVSLLHSGLNLYNNGFAAGLLCIFLIPIYEEFHHRFPKSKLFLNIHHIKE